MRSARSPRSSATRQLTMGALLLALALGAQLGCTREFYREWANQDVSEAVFEKTRDPRWRMDIFSIEPPMLSRYADPYDQDVPPAPPDDPAAEALSPVPQWPDNRLLVPVEGTGYQDLLEYWKRADDAKLAAAGKPVPVEGPEYWERPDEGHHPVTDPRQPGLPGQPLTSPAGPPVPPNTSSPFTDVGQGATQPPRVLPPTPGNQPPAAVPRPGSLPPAPPSGAQSPPGPQAMLDRGLSDRRAMPDRQIVRLQNGEDSQVSSQTAPGAPRTNSRTNPNSGTGAQVSSPIPVSGAVPSAGKKRIPPPRAGSSFAKVGPSVAKSAKDRSVSPASLQESGQPAQPESGSGSGMRTEVLQVVSPLQNQPVTLPAPGQPGAARPQDRPPPPAAPSNILDREIATEPPILNQRQLEEVGRMAPADMSKLNELFVPQIELQNDTEGYGYPKGSRVYKINMQQALLLAIMNARFYQYNLEQVYEAALAVTLQRFSFEPQFYAGMSPLTGVPQNNGAGGSFPSSPGLITTNAFNYATRFSPTGQVSTLNLGTVAGFGKLFSSGGQLLMGFANEVAFNFLSKNPQQPTVISALPISFMQPLLRGGGRAVVLENLTNAERQLLYAVRAFALFRQQFFVVTLTGGSVQNFGNNFTLAGFSSPAGNTDPTIGFLPVVFNLVEIEVDRRNLIFLENIARLYTELIQGESSGLSRLQLDQVMQRVIATRLALFNDQLTYRLQLDEFKMQMSLPPDLPLVVDMSLAQPFYDVFTAVDEWQRNPGRTLLELPYIIAKLPELEDIDVEGRSVLAPYRNFRSTTQEFRPSNEEGLEDTLQAAVRIALEYRQDLMNTRAGLYDSWRQIRVAANALKGYLTVGITNNVYTTPAPPNPLDFLSQAKQFSLTLQTELPLVRVVERNAFRTALINYQRNRRALQGAEDNLKIQLRNDLRQVHYAYINYEIAKRNFELNVRLKDQAFEQIIAPPAGGTQNLAQSANAATQTTNLLTFQANLIGAMLSLTNGWASYQTQRLIVYRDIGILPYDEWEAFSELYPSQYHGPILGHAPAGGAGFTPPPEARTATPESR
jgi:hypothetical protein